MTKLSKWAKEKTPGIYGFIKDFFDAMNNKKGGHSLRKWLAVGFYWIMFKISIEYTTPENLVAVLGIHAGMITALVITYTVGNNAEKKIQQTINESLDGKQDENQ